MNYTLEEALHLHPVSLSSNGSKLSLVGKQISSFGLRPLPRTISDPVKVLYISNNSLSSLNGIEQFRYLR
jgi:hypothetical protein